MCIGWHLWVGHHEGANVAGGSLQKKAKAGTNSGGFKIRPLEAYERNQTIDLRTEANKIARVSEANSRPALADLFGKG